MSEMVKRNWWILAPVALIAFGGYAVLIHVLGDGFESQWERTAAGWDPSLVERVGSAASLGILLVVLPTWALVIRRRHPGLTVIMLLPVALVSLTPLMWSDPGALIVFPILGLITLVGAVMNLAQDSVREGPGTHEAVSRSS